MKSFILSFIFIFSMTTPVWAASESPSSKWRSITSKGGEFSVQMPGKPQFSFRTEDTSVGDVDIFLYTLNTPQGEYTAEYSELPSIAKTFATSKKVLNETKKNFLKEVGGKEVSFKAVKYDKYPGRELVYTVRSEGEMRTGKARFYKIDDKVYVLDVSAPSKRADVASMNRFVNSFQLVE